MKSIFYVSASQVKDWLRCHRAWFLKYALRVADDARAGGKYLEAGTALDECVQLWSAKMDLDERAVLARLRKEYPNSVLTDAERIALIRRAYRQLRTMVPYLPAPKSAVIQHRYRVHVPGVDAVVGGKPDLLRRDRDASWVIDTKTTSDRGPGRGSSGDAPAYALTDETIRDDVQARLYSWCEFQLRPEITHVYVQWVYVSKADAPTAWYAKARFDRADTEAWFARVMRPIIAEMMAAAAAKTENDVAADHDGCSRCFTKLACNPYDGKQKEYDVMVFDLNKLKRAQAQRAEADEKAGLVPSAYEGGDPPLAETLAASVAVVAINRPRIAPPNTPPVDAIVADTEVEAPADPKAEATTSAHEPGVGATGTQSPVSTTVEPPPARRRRRRAAAEPPAVDAGKAALVAADQVWLLNALEELATAHQTIRDRADAIIADIDKRIATLRGGGS